jgi:hypothetical protein
MPSANALRQPTRRELLIPYWVDRTDILGVVGLRSRVRLHLERGGGRPPGPLTFVVDSGASYSLISLELAQRRHIPVPPPEAEIDLTLQTAQGTKPFRVRPGRMRAWWDEKFRGYPFDWPVLFQVGAPLGLPSILGLGGIVKTCRWTFDGSYSLDSPYGYLTLDDIR